MKQYARLLQGNPRASIPRRTGGLTAPRKVFYRGLRRFAICLRAREVSSLRRAKGQSSDCLRTEVRLVFASSLRRTKTAAQLPIAEKKPAPLSGTGPKKLP